MENIIDVIKDEEAKISVIKTPGELGAKVCVKGSKITILLMMINLITDLLEDGFTYDEIDFILKIAKKGGTDKNIDLEELMK